MTLLLSIWIVGAMFALSRCWIEASEGEASTATWRAIGALACLVWPVALVPLAAYAYASRAPR